MLSNNKAYMKLIIGSTFGVLILLGGLVFKCQENKIDSLKDELYLKKQNEQRATDYYESVVNIKTIQTEFNTLKEYPVQKNCKVNMNHRYIYSTDGALGIKKEIILKGRGQVQYNINIRFDTAVISSVDGKNIKVQIQKPYVDEESIKLVENTLIMDQQDFSFWSSRQDSTQAQKLYMDSFVDSARDNVLDLYKDRERQAYINKVAIAETQALIRTLNLNNCNVYVEIIE